MNEYLPSPEFLLQMKVATAAPSAPDVFVRNLRGRLLNRCQAAQSRSRMRARLAWGLAAATILLLAGVLIAGPQNVVSALQKILGYIPGIGIVQPGSIRVLAEPVTLTRDGITVTLEQVVADSTQTIVVYKAEGLSVAVANSNGEGGPFCSGTESVRLPDGEGPAFGGGGAKGWGSGYRSTLKYAAIPPEVNDAEFLIPCLMDMPPGKAPEDWRIPFRLVPAPPDMTVFPVEEISASAPEVTPLPGAPTPESGLARGITLSLENAVSLDDGYLLTGRLLWDSNIYSSVMDDMAGWKLTDADGKEVPFEQQRVILNSPVEPGSYPWEMKVKGKSFRGPLRLAMESAQVMLVNPVFFSFDPGSAPMEGKEWTINRDFEVLGLSVKILSARFLSDTSRQGFEFTVRADPGIASLYIGYDTYEKQTGFDTKENVDANSSSDSRPGPDGTILADAWVDVNIIGKVNLSIEQISLAGPWVAVWNPTAAGGDPTPTKAETYGITLSLDRVVTLDEGYALLGSVHWQDDRFASVADTLQAVVTDAGGMPIPVERDYDDYGMVQTVESNSTPWAYRIQGKAFHGPLTLAFHSVGVDLQDPVPLQFDTGTNPRLGQSWELDQSFQVLGIPVTLSSAKAISQGDMQGFEFTVQAPLALHSMELGFEKSEGLVQTKERCCSSGGGSSPNRTGTFKTYALTDFSLVGGTINLSVRHVELSGNWSVEWNPPVVEGWPTATPLPQACLTDAKWSQIANGPALPLPAGLGGKILTLRGALAPDPSLFLSGVDGSGEKGLVFGDGSLSPDGSQLVFAGQDDRLYVMDLESGATTALTAPGITGNRPIWSPDGKHIAMTQLLENPHVVVMNADGSGLRRVTKGVSYEWLAGWSGDGKQLLYTVLGDGGKNYLKLADIDTGVITDLFAIAWKNPSAALSPDGNWVAYMDRPFGSFSASVYIARLDGSDRRLMAQLDAQPFYLFSPFWSPDGRWLAVSLQDANAFIPSDPSIALIQTDTCEVVPMPNVTGEIRSWVP
jgi:hypothetical protein